MKKIILLISALLFSTNIGLSQQKWEYLELNLNVEYGGGDKSVATYYLTFPDGSNFNSKAGNLFVGEPKFVTVWNSNAKKYGLVPIDSKYENTDIAKRPDLGPIGFFNQLGKSGWELMHVDIQKDTYATGRKSVDRTYWFKRPKAN